MSERPGRGLEPPAAFGGKIGVPRKSGGPGRWCLPLTCCSGPEDLIPPSHFKGRTHDPGLVDIWAALSKATKDILELRQENERLSRMQGSSRGCSEFEKEKICNTARSLQQEMAPWSHEVAEQTEKKQEVEQLRGKVAQQAATVACLGKQLAELRAELRRLKPEAGRAERSQAQRLEAEVEQLGWERDRSAQEAERQRSELEELREQQDGSARQTEETSRENRSQLLARTQSLDKDREALRQRAAELEEELRQCREKGQCEAAHLRERLEVVGQERDTLQEEMSKARCKLESQSSLIQQLRTYIGQLVPDEKQLEEARQEKEQLSRRVQHLEKERETLRATVELLNVRLTSLTDILAIQESDRSGKTKLDIPKGDSGKRASLVTCWREKVFALMVQLKSQEIRHTNDIGHLQAKVANLEEELAGKDQEHAVLVHSLHDRTAEVDMERVKNQSLRDDLAAAQNNMVRLQEKADRADSALRHLQELISSFYQKFLDQEEVLKKSLCQLVNLSQRVTFANKRIDTIHGLCARKEALARLQLQERSRETGRDVGRRTYEDLEKELELLNGERDHLAAELKLNSHLIEKKVTEARLKFEEELKDHLAVTGQLEEALEEKRRQHQRLTEELTEAQQGLGDAREAGEALRAELCRQQGKYEEALQEKVAEAERQMAEQLSEMEKRLNQARREHTKAVVALRQTYRQAARNKERMEACGKLQEERHQRETQRLSEQLRELERDKNLLTATLRQEGLLSQFKKSRAVAIHTSAALSDQSEPSRALPQSQVSRARDKDTGKDSLAEVLKELQVLSVAVIADQEDREMTEEDEETE